MSSPDLSSTTQPVQTASIIRRAGIADIEAVCDAAWKLADISAAAHWPRTAYYPYVTLETAGSGLQAKAMFVACVGTPEGRTPPTSRENLNAIAEQIIGFAAFFAITDGGECALENMAVAEPWRKRGIGMRLLSAGLLWCRAHSGSSVWLEVRASNHGAIALYERAGFSIVGRRPGYYSEPAETALQMQKLLGPIA